MTNTLHDTRETFPESVHELAAWLKAHPCVKNIKVSAKRFEAYLLQLQEGRYLRPVIERPHAFYVRNVRVWHPESWSLRLVTRH